MTTAAAIWRSAYVGVGSNLSGPAGQVETALDELESLPETRLVARSHLYRSAPFGGIEQPDFVNAVAALLTKLDARELLMELKRIEVARGRDADERRWGPRIIDLDLLAYSTLVVEEPGLTLPHPGIAERNFVLLPLGEVAPDLVIPTLGRVAAISVNEQEPRIERIE